jgi:Ca-activated chloride channel homolog
LRIRRVAAAAVAGATLALGAPAFMAAQTPAPLAVAFVAPASGQPLIGVVDVRLRVSGGPASRVELYVDGVLAQTLLKAPWRAQVDVGPEPRAHRLEAVVYARDGTSASASLEAQALRTDLEIAVNLQPVFVKVRKNGQPVRGLRPADFTIRDDGVEQRLVTFEYGSIPFSAVLLLDASASMAGDRIGAAIAGTQSFVRALQPLDQTKLMVFADRLMHETPFTNLPAILTLGLGSVQARGGSAVADALALGSARLERERGRRVLVLLSDGLDVDSVLDIEVVRRAARRTQTVVYWLRTGDAAGTGDGYVTLWRQPGTNARIVRGIGELVAESGGRTIDVASPAAVGEHLAEVLAELREQYVLGYYPTTLKGSGSWHALAVEVRGGGEVRAQRGYTEP